MMWPYQCDQAIVSDNALVDDIKITTYNIMNIIWSYNLLNTSPHVDHSLLKASGW